MSEQRDVDLASTESGRPSLTWAPGATKYHLCMNVRGFLSSAPYPDGFVGVFKHDDGTPMTPEEAREQLFDQLALGHEVIPMGGCDNFDFKTGCQGHPEKGAVRE